MLIRNVDDLITTLGGNNAVLKLFRPRMRPNVVAMWRIRNQLPPRSYVVLAGELQRAGHQASPALWDMYRPAKKNGHDN